MDSYETLGDGCRIYTSKEHTFGTDAFLLADFAKARRKDTVVDLGTGCGIIAMLIRLRYGSADVWGVDIQQQAIDQFDRSVADSKIDRIHPVLMDIKEIGAPLPVGRCDLVTCNPPYKAVGAGMVSEAAAEKIARHETACDIDDICRGAAKLLRYGGRLCLCNRPERLADLICSMRAADIEPKRLRFVSKDECTPPWLFLIEGRKGGRPFMTVESPLYMKTGGISQELAMIYGMDSEEKGSVK